MTSTEQRKKNQQIEAFPERRECVALFKNNNNQKKTKTTKKNHLLLLVCSPPPDPSRSRTLSVGTPMGLEGERCVEKNNNKTAGEKQPC